MCFGGSASETAEPKLYMRQQLTKNLTPGEYSAAKLAQYQSEHPGRDPYEKHDYEEIYNRQTAGDTTAYQKTLTTAPPDLADAAQQYAQAAKARMVKSGQGRKSTFLTGNTLLGGGQ